MSQVTRYPKNYCKKTPDLIDEYDIMEVNEYDKSSERSKHLSSNLLVLFINKDKLKFYE